MAIPSERALSGGLSENELQVLRLAASRVRPKDISREMGISDRAVIDSLEEAVRKLSVTINTDPNRSLFETQDATIEAVIQRYRAQAEQAAKDAVREALGPIRSEKAAVGLASRAGIPSWVVTGLFLSASACIAVLLSPASPIPNAFSFAPYFIVAAPILGVAAIIKSFRS